MSSSLFSVCNAFHLGAYQVAINEASELTELSATEQVEKDCYAYRSYVALGSYQVHHRIALFFSSLSLFGFFLSLFVCVARRRGETRGDRSSGVDGETTTTTKKKKKKKKKRFDGALKSLEKLK